MGNLLCRSKSAAQTTDFSEDAPVVLVVGASGVGKTALVQQLSFGTFPVDHRPSLIDSYECHFVVDVCAARVSFVEISGALRGEDLHYDDEVKEVASKATAVVYVYDLTSTSSLEQLPALRSWLVGMRSELDSLPRVILANKSDLARVVTEAQTSAMAQQFLCPHGVATATDRDQVETALRTLIQRLFASSSAATASAAASTAAPASAPASPAPIAAGSR